MPSITSTSVRHTSKLETRHGASCRQTPQHQCVMPTSLKEPCSMMTLARRVCHHHQRNLSGMKPDMTVDENNTVNPSRLLRGGVLRVGIHAARQENILVHCLLARGRDNQQVGNWCCVDKSGSTKKSHCPPQTAPRRTAVATARVRSGVTPICWNGAETRPVQRNLFTTYRRDTTARKM